MLNAAGALSILGGGSGGGGSSISSLTLFKQIRKNEVAYRERFLSRVDVKRDIDNFKNRVGKLEGVDDLVKDRRVLGVLLSAFGLESEINNPGKIKVIINSDPTDVNSFANRLNDPRFAALAAFVDAPNKDLINLVTARKQQEVIDKFLANEFQKNVGAQNPAVRDAFFFLNKINDVNSTFGILGDLPLRSIVTSALRLPPQIAQQSVNKQASLIEAKFDIGRARLGGAAESTSKNEQERLTDDIAALEIATAQVTAAETAIAAIKTQLGTIRTKLSDLANVTAVDGVNATEIPIQKAALPDLIRQSGLIASANDALSRATPLFDELDGLFQQLRNAKDQDALDVVISQFTTQADKILGNQGLINSANYTDPNTGTTENLLRPTGDRALGITAITDSKIVTAVKADGTAVAITGFDLSGFLTKLQSARDQVAATNLATRTADVAAAENAFDMAQTDFSGAGIQNGVNVASFGGTTAGVGFAHSLGSQALAKGISSVDDANTRVAATQGLLDEIRQLTLAAVVPGADLVKINESFALKVSALQSTINTPGSVTDGTSTISFDNLLTSGTQDYIAESGVSVRANGGTFDTTILAALPASITAANAATLKNAIDNTYRPAADAVARDLGRNRTTLNFVANTVDPQGALDAEIRKLTTDLNTLVAAAAEEGENLIQPFANDLRIALTSVGSVLSVSAQTDFKDTFNAALSSFSYTVLHGGSVAERTSLLNDALFAAGSTTSKLKGDKFALKIQSTILNEKTGRSVQTESTFLKPLKNTAYAVKFIEQYLIQKDLEAQGGSLGPVNNNAALIGLIRNIAPASGLNLNLFL
ncbi:MAG: DUF1217 domain-containing protein [Alphaproteobacteria bacterium]|nr:DUF1217 domain-containing protein [Alphaproteobacteria bacterium]